MTKLKDVYKINTCSYKDIAYAYKKQKNVIFDYSRSQSEYFNYMAMEALKNGEMFSGKYHSHQVIFSPAKVLVFANYPPDVSKLSQDRWDIYKIIEDKLVKVLYTKLNVQSGGDYPLVDSNRDIKNISRYKSRRPILTNIERYEKETSLRFSDIPNYILTKD